MPQNISFFLCYGDREFFEKMMAEGYTEISSAVSRQWCHGCWVIALFVFSGKPPEKESMPFMQIPTWRVLKKMSLENRGSYEFPVPHEERYSSAALDIFLRRHDLRLGFKLSLVEVVAAWDVDYAKNALQIAHNAFAHEA